MSISTTAWSSRLAGVLVFLAVSAGADLGPKVLELAGGETELRLNAHLLGDLGISTVTHPGVGDRFEFERYEFPILDTESLGLALPGGSYRGPVSGVLVHDAEFGLEWASGRVSLAGFELHPGLPPNAFELRAADGSLVFVLDNPHPQRGSDGREFLFLDMDLRLSGQFAERLGRQELEGLAVGEAHVRARVRSPGGRASLDSAPVPAPGSPQGAGGICVPDFEGPVDVLLESMTSVSETYHDDTRVALAPAVRLQNVGTADVPWFRSIAPDGWVPFKVVGQHPFLVMHLYRTASGRIQQIGRSDAKHAFFSGNTPPCDCQADQVLFNDCTDLYGASTNANRLFLAPREEVTASTGTWARTGSHFDGAPVDDMRDHTGSPADHPDPFEHRLTAAVADLETPDAEYRLEGWYLVQDDIDITNSMGHRAILPIAPASTGPWTFPFDDLALTLGSVLDTWVDPLAPPPGAANVPIATDPDEGELGLAVKTSDLGGGFFHYEYALMNFDFDRQVGSLRVPVPLGSTIQNAWFGDVDSDAGNDWVFAVNAGDITWTAPVGNALDWGTLFNFAFDVDAPPSALPITLGVSEPGEPGQPDSLVLVALAPASSSEIEVILDGTGVGRVTSSPAGIDCAGDCAETLANGTWLDLAAAASPGSAFVRWRENAVTVGLDLDLGLAVGGDRSLHAVFDTCQADVVLTPQTVSVPTVFHACESLAAGTGFLVASEAIFRVGSSIALDDGFTVGAGAAFRAEIVPGQRTLP